MKFKKIELENGLPLILIPRKKTQSIAIFFATKAGSEYDPQQEKGLAHFLEHMLMKGTKKRPNNLELTRSIEKLGGSFHSTVSKTMVHFIIQIPAPDRNLSLVLDILSDIIFNSRLREEDIEKEKEIIAEEIKMSENNDEKFLFYRLLYGNQPPGWPVAGTIETINKIRKKHLEEFLSRYYSAQNSVLSICGNFNPKKAVKEVKHYFGSLPSTQVPSLEVKEELQTNCKVQYKDASQTSLLFGVRACSLIHPHRFALFLLTTILGRGIDSRLFQSLREKEGLCYYVEAGLDLCPHRGVFVIQAEIHNEKVRSAIFLILKEFKEICQGKIKEEELEEAKQKLIGRMKLDYEDPYFLVAEFGIQQLLERKISTVEKLSQTIQRIKLEEVIETAQDLFKPEKFNLVLAGPHSSDSELEFRKILENF